MRSALRSETYDAVARRGNVLTDFTFCEKNKEKNTLNNKKKPLEIKESTTFASDSNKKKIIKPKTSSEEKKNEKNDKNLLEQIYQILIDNKKEEMMKLSQIYELMGIKNLEKENYPSNNKSSKMEEEMI